MTTSESVRKILDNKEKLWTNHGLKIRTITYDQGLGNNLPFILTIEGQRGIYRANHRGHIHNQDGVYLDYRFVIRDPLIKLNWNQLPIDTMIAVQDPMNRIYIRKLRYIENEFAVTIHPSTGSEERWSYAKVISQLSQLMMPKRISPGLNLVLTIRGKQVGIGSEFIEQKELDIDSTTSVFIKGVAEGYDPFLGPPFRQCIYRKSLQSDYIEFSKSLLA